MYIHHIKIFTLSVLSSSVLLAGCGNDSTTVTYHDTTPPTLTINTDIDGEYSHRSQLSIEGNASDDNQLKTVNIRIGDKDLGNINVAADGHFSQILQLDAGSNNIIITATDMAGNQTSKNASIYYGSTLAAGNAHTMALVNNTVYGWGRNNFGQTGIGKTSKLGDDADHPSLPTRITALPDDIVSIVVNQNHSAAISKDGKLYTWGDDGDGQLGRGDLGRQDCGSRGTDNCRLDIAAISDLPSIKYVAAGYNHMLALDTQGQIWAFGSNSHGQLGKDSSTESSSTPILVDFGSTQAGTIVQVIASANSSYAVDDQGKLWAWGRNQYGNLGQGTLCNPREGCTDLNPTPVVVKLPEGVHITEAATGRDHVLARSDDGKVYAWGLNATSQVGYMGEGYKDTEQAWDSYVTTPKLLPWSQSHSAKHVYANGNSSFILSSDKKVYHWGMYGETNKQGRTLYNNLNEPTNKIPALTEVMDMSVGGLHQIAKRKDGGIFSWGWSFESSLGAADVSERWMHNTPIAVQIPN